MRDLDAEIDLRLPEIKRKEQSFEYALRDELETMGIGFVKLKPTIRAFPDRLAMGHGWTRLVEVKREGEEARRSQIERHEELWRKYKIRVLVVEGPDVKKAAQLIQMILRLGQ